MELVYCDSSNGSANQFTYLFIFLLSFWGGFFDALPASYLLQRLIIMISDRLLLSSKNFEKISETDWDENKEKAYKSIKAPYRAMSYVLAFVYLFGLIFAGVTPVYVRYLADRALETSWEAEVRINTTDNYYIDLNEETRPDALFMIEDFDESKELYISLNTLRIPERMNIYINGKDTGFKYDAMNLKKLAMWRWKDKLSTLPPCLNWALYLLCSVFKMKNPIFVY